MSDNNERRLSFSKNLIVTPSGRGYVTAHVRGTSITVTKCMDEALKSRIGSMPPAEYKATGDAQWRAAMKKLEELAIDEAKEEFRKINP
jgi:hypothetical protein